jgi:Flp pilus assembly protein TadG
MLRKLLKDQEGAAAVESAVLIFSTLLLIGGGVDFMLAFNQWNSALKAAERGARMAAVSAPIDERLHNICTQGCAGKLLGTSLSDVRWTSVCTSSGCSSADAVVTSAAGSNFNSAALNTIVNGRPAGAGVPAYTVGMADMCCCLPGTPPACQIKPENVRVTYRGTGLGFVGRPGGAVPTITVTVSGMPFNFFWLDKLLGYQTILMPPISVTVTGEDLCLQDSCA